MQESRGAIELGSVSKVYTTLSQPVHALRDINLKIAGGQVLAVTGPSGSGKSTLLQLIGALDRPTSGRITIDSVPVTELPDRHISRFRNRAVGFVFQLNNLLPEFDALENVMMPGIIAGRGGDELKGHALNLLKMVGLEDRRDHRPGEMSGGEQQRVAIARALVMRPSIILADEPTGNLDVRNGEIVANLLIELCQRHGLTMLLVTHDLRLAGRFSLHIAMEDGRILDHGGND